MPINQIQLNKFIFLGNTLLSLLLDEEEEVEEEEYDEELLEFAETVEFLFVLVLVLLDRLLRSISNKITT
jgi:hypothetical protein